MYHLQTFDPSVKLRDFKLWLVSISLNLFQSRLMVGSRNFWPEVVLIGRTSLEVKVDHGLQKDERDDHLLAVGVTFEEGRRRRCRPKRLRDVGRCELDQKLVGVSSDDVIVVVVVAWRADFHSSDSLGEDFKIVGRRSVEFAHCRRPANWPSNTTLSSLGFFD